MQPGVGAAMLQSSEGEGVAVTGSAEPGSGAAAANQATAKQATASATVGSEAVAAAEPAETSLTIVERYLVHGSIAYGADWWAGACKESCPSHVAAMPCQQATECVAKGGGVSAGSSHTAGSAETALGSGSRRDVVATCSFYNNLLHVWSPASSGAQS